MVCYLGRYTNWHSEPIQLFTSLVTQVTSRDTSHRPVAAANKTKSKLTTNAYLRVVQASFVFLMLALLTRRPYRTKRQNRRSWTQQVAFFGSPTGVLLTENADVLPSGRPPNDKGKKQ